MGRKLGERMGQQGGPHRGIVVDGHGFNQASGPPMRHLVPVCCSPSLKSPSQVNVASQPRVNVMKSVMKSPLLGRGAGIRGRTAPLGRMKLMTGCPHCSSLCSPPYMPSLARRGRHAAPWIPPHVATGG